MRGYDFFFSFHLILHPITYSVFTHLLLDLGQGGFWSLSLISLLQIRTTSWPYISYSTHNHSAVNEGVEQSGDSRLKTMPAKRLHSSVPQPWCLKKGLPGTWTQMSCRYMVWQYMSTVLQCRLAGLCAVEVATHSGILAWRIPGTEEPGGLPSMGSHRVGNDGSYSAEAAAGHWERCSRT